MNGPATPRDVRNLGLVVRRVQLARTGLTVPALVAWGRHLGFSPDDVRRLVQLGFHVRQLRATLGLDDESVISTFAAPEPLAEDLAEAERAERVARRAKNIRRPLKEERQLDELDRLVVRFCAERVLSREVYALLLSRGETKAQIEVRVQRLKRNGVLHGITRGPLSTMVVSPAYRRKQNAAPAKRAGGAS